MRVFYLICFYKHIYLFGLFPSKRDMNLGHGEACLSRKKLSENTRHSIFASRSYQRQSRES